jgi:predicted hotdog family 3-hydroxylacyl-ACP dehydratase
MFPDIADLLPHRPPFLMLESVQEASGHRLVARAKFQTEDYGVAGDAVLAGALVECLAQAVAALQGLAAWRRGQALPRGMLVGVDDFTVLTPVRPGQALAIEVVITRELPPFALAEGAITRGGEVVARGGLKFFLQDDADAAQKKTPA